MKSEEHSEFRNPGRLTYHRGNTSIQFWDGEKWVELGLVENSTPESVLGLIPSFLNSTSTVANPTSVKPKRMLRCIG